MENRLKEIIQDYKDCRKNNPDSWVTFCKIQKRFIDTIEFAAIAKMINLINVPTNKRLVIPY